MNTETKLPNPAALDMLQTAFNKGEIKFWPVNSYTANGFTTMPKLGHILYRIYFEQESIVIYNGCYEMQLKISDKLKQVPGQLEAFLCWELAPIITP